MKLRLPLLSALLATAAGQDPVPPGTPAAAPAQSEIQKWIATTGAQWQANFKHNVTDVREAELNKVRAQFQSSLDAAIAKASASGNLDGAVALRNEKERFFDTKTIPEQDLATEAASIKQLRAPVRIAQTKLEKDHAARVTALHANYDELLAQAQTQLTQRQRLDEALEVKAQRDKIAATWLKGVSVLPLSLNTATKERPRVNSLGMKFVPVAGTKVLFSVWETRVRDYEAFLKTKRLAWEKSYEQGPTHPAGSVSWDDAQAFCVWLSRKEGIEYRLPTDAEWSAAVGLRGEEGATPEEKDSKTAGFPWGGEWPPPQGAGNYRSSLGVDKFFHTAPVGSFPANGFGIYDLGGNVAEWCEDRHKVTQTARIVRGGSFGDYDRDRLKSSCRSAGDATYGDSLRGFRVVMAGSSSAR